MTGPEKTLTDEHQVRDTAAELHIMLSNCEQDKTLNLLPDYLLCQGKRLNSLKNFQSNIFPTENSALCSCYFVIEICWLHQDQRKMFKLIQDRAYCCLLLLKCTFSVLLECSSLIYYIKQHHHCFILKWLNIEKTKIHQIRYFIENTPIPLFL